MERHCHNAAAVADWLADRPEVVRLRYPGRPGAPGHDLAAAQMSASGAPLYGGVVSFELESAERALDVCARTRVFFLAESLGGVESLIEHPARMTHLSLAGSGLEVSDSLIRVSVGIEHRDDLIEDLAGALEGSAR